MTKMKVNVELIRSLITSGVTREEIKKRMNWTTAQAKEIFSHDRISGVRTGTREVPVELVQEEVSHDDLKDALASFGIGGGETVTVTEELTSGADEDLTNMADSPTQQDPQISENEASTESTEQGSSSGTIDWANN